MKFYKAQAAGASVYGLMARDGDELYAYLANTGLWHRSSELETDFYFDQEGIYAEVTPEEVSALMAGVQRIDERGAGGTHVRRRRSQPVEDKRTSAALGLITNDPRPVTGKELVTLIKQTPKGKWVTLKRYKPEKRQAARQLVYEMRNGKKKALVSVGPLDVRFVANPPGGDIEVQIKKKSAPKAGKTASEVPVR